MRIKRMSQIYTTNTNRYRWYTYLLLFLCYFSRNATAVDNHDCTGVTGDPVCNALNDERISPETFYTSAPSSIIVGTSGGISAISSLLIMFIIVRSNIRFSTVSHRLVFAMSSADVICSIGMAAGTLAMPKNMVYDFEGKTIGNEFTCSLQGFLVFFAGFATMAYNACLSVYFMCSITYKMKDAKIRKCVEPFMHVVCILATLPTAILFWVHKWYNPTPNDTWCVAVSYPYYCNPEYEHADSCSIRGSPSSYQIASRKALKLYYVVFFFLGPIITVWCMFRIIRTVYLQEKHIKAFMRCRYSRLARMNLSTERENRMLEMSQQRLDYTKIMLVQCTGYIIACVIPAGSIIIHIASIGINPEQDLELSRTGLIFQVLYTALRPCQGLLNFIVFFGQKVHAKRQLNPALTRRQAAMKVLSEREEPHFDIAGISLVRNYHLNDNSDGSEELYEFDGADDIIVEETGGNVGHDMGDGSEGNSPSASIDDVKKNQQTSASSSPNKEAEISEQTPASSSLKEEDISYGSSNLHSLYNITEEGIDRFSNSMSNFSSRVSWNSSPVNSSQIDVDEFAAEGAD